MRIAALGGNALYPQGYLLNDAGPTWGSAPHGALCRFEFVSARRDRPISRAMASPKEEEMATVAQSKKRFAALGFAFLRVPATWLFALGSEVYARAIEPSIVKADAKKGPLAQAMSRGSALAGRGRGCSMTVVATDDCHGYR